MPILLLLLLLQPPQLSQAATLSGYAKLPADTFVPGPTSGQFIEPANNRRPPFKNQQPVQGFSALIRQDHGTFIVLSDNGFGKRGNSSDYLLGIYHVQPDFRTANGGEGNIEVSQVIHFSDPDRHMPYPVTRASDRLLTGADLDPESFRRMPDGSYWIGEEFNPSLLHISAGGVLLAPPFRLAGLASVDNPQGHPATLGLSRGFEGMAMSPDGRWLYPMLEGPLLENGEPVTAHGLNIYTFDLQRQQFVNPGAITPSFRYRLDQGASAIGDFTLYSDTAGLVIERDSKYGTDALVKRLYKVDFKHLDADGFLFKTLVADLLDIRDPHDLDRDGSDLFKFPFWTIEGLLVIDRTTLGIVNDNNYPFGRARETPDARPDNNEFILIEVAPLWE